MLRALDRDTHRVLYETAMTTRENADDAGDHDAAARVSWRARRQPVERSRVQPRHQPALRAGGRLVRDVLGVRAGALHPGQDATWAAEPISIRRTKAQGWLTAVDASTGAVKWKYRSPRPMVAAVTTTAGNLVLTGELTGDFVVFDARNGDVLYRFNTGGPIGGGIVTYAAGGRQYIAVASGSPSNFWVERNPGAPRDHRFRTAWKSGELDQLARALTQPDEEEDVQLWA